MPDQSNVPNPSRNLLHEVPWSAREDWLVNEPLIVQDWQEVYDAHCAFTVHVRLIVDRARKRKDAEVTRPAFENLLTTEEFK